jgi:hypothetical protein
MNTTRVSCTITIEENGSNYARVVINGSDRPTNFDINLDCANAENTSQGE